VQLGGWEKNTVSNFKRKVLYHNMDSIPYLFSWNSVNKILKPRYEKHAAHNLCSPDFMFRVKILKAGGYGLRSISSLILFGIRKNYLIRGRGLLLYQFTRRTTKLTVVIIVEYQ
jgi:hypothetical protein